MFNLFINSNQTEGTHMTIMEVKNLSKVYGKDEMAVKALDDVSFTNFKPSYITLV